MKLFSWILAKIFLGVIVLLLSCYGVLLAYIAYSDSAESKIVNNVKSIYARYQTPHIVELLEDGKESLKKRIEMIRNAKEEIEMEFFIYELDLVSRFVTNELIDAAKRGVKVRLLVDYSIAVFKLAPEYSHFLKSVGIEVRYYNTITNANFIAVQHRNHRKLLITDRSNVITGGRNVANEYFDMAQEYNFLDYDIFVEGEIVKDIRQSFYQYWESSYASDPTFVEKNIAASFYAKNNEFEEIYSLIESYNKDPSRFTCQDIAYTTDFPGVLVQNRQVYRRIEEMLSEVKETVYVESPYLVLRSEGRGLIENVIKKGVKFSILTNSLYSTDAYYTVSALALTLDDIDRLGLDLYLYQGDAPRQRDDLSSEARKSRWGIHSKRAVLDEKHTIIGTYNIDPRSANLNSEMIIICRDNPEIAHAVLENLQGRMDTSLKMTQNHYQISDLIREASFSSKLKFYLSMPLVYFLGYLL